MLNLRSANKTSNKAKHSFKKSLKKKKKNLKLYSKNDFILKIF